MRCASLRNSRSMVRASDAGGLSSARRAHTDTSVSACLTCAERPVSLWWSVCSLERERVTVGEREAWEVRQTGSATNRRRDECEV